MGNYPEELVAPIREDLRAVGFEEMMTASDVENLINKGGNTVLVVNSVCGCAAGIARPALKMSLQVGEVTPDHKVTAFAGMEMEAVNKAREFMMPYPPSSPCIAMFKDGELKKVIERHQIEGTQLPDLVNNIVEGYKESFA